MPTTGIGANERSLAALNFRPALLTLLAASLVASCQQQAEPETGVVTEPAVTQAPQIPRRPDYTQFVDPFIGTDGSGHQFPGAVVPFGMVQPGPDNRLGSQEHASGYQYGDPQIIGFSQTHASGSSTPLMGDVRLLPFRGTAGPDMVTTYAKDSESASPGYYRVTLKESDITVELTATQRVAFHRYSFTGTEPLKVLLDLGNRLGPAQNHIDLQITIGSAEIAGTAWFGEQLTQQLHFAVKFDQPIDEWESLGEDSGRYALTFKAAQGELVVRAAVSTVSPESALDNLDEMPHWNFDAVAEAARVTWNEMLARAVIEGSRRQKRIFFTALYRAFIHPSDISDRDGRYRGADGEVRQAPGGVYYSSLAPWSTYRALHPLLTLLAPERVDGFINSMLAHHRAQGYLPNHTVLGQETHLDIGNPALPVIADAAIKGFSGFDANAALAAMVKSSSLEHENSGWNTYLQHSYYPFDLIDTGSVSKTLEASLGDAAVAQMATELGEEEIAARFAARSQFYRNLYHGGQRVMRGRDSQGDWREPFDPYEATSDGFNPGDYTDGNAGQYLWTPAMHDVDGIIAILGGRDRLTGRLDQFFSQAGYGESPQTGQEGLIGQYAHGTAPSHHVAWLYAFSSDPRRGQARIRQIAGDFYSDQPDGITGNGDFGQMSAWYIFTTLGFYPVNPFSGQYVLGAPLVKAARLQVGKRVLQIEATDGSAVRPFSRETYFDGRRLAGPMVSHRRLAGGGTLTFIMTD